MQQLLAKSAFPIAACRADGIPSEKSGLNSSVAFTAMEDSSKPPSPASIDLLSRSKAEKVSRAAPVDPRKAERDLTKDLVMLNVFA